MNEGSQTDKWETEYWLEKARDHRKMTNKFLTLYIHPSIHITLHGICLFKGTTSFVGEYEVYLSYISYDWTCQIGPSKKGQGFALLTTTFSPAWQLSISLSLLHPANKLRLQDHYKAWRVSTVPPLSYPLPKSRISIIYLYMSWPIDGRAQHANSTPVHALLTLTNWVPRNEARDLILLPWANTRFIAWRFLEYEVENSFQRILWRMIAVLYLYSIDFMTARVLLSSHELYQERPWVGSLRQCWLWRWIMMLTIHDQHVGSADQNETSIPRSKHCTTN